jgi:anti-anti-sigma regulatory factor
MEYETPDMMVRVQDLVTIVRFRAESLTSTVDVARLSDALQGIVEDGARRLVLDFKNVRNAGSAALGMMIAIQKRLKELDGLMGISHPENLESLFRISHTGRLFSLFPDTRAAFTKLKPY